MMFNRCVSLVIRAKVIKLVKAIIYRVSLVKMLFSKYVKRGTPSPFVEMRAFIFSKTKPTMREEILYRKGLEAVINNTENLFVSIVDAKKQNLLDSPEWSSIETQGIDTETPPTQRVVMEIDGFEVEEVDIDEVSKYYKSEKMEFDEIYRYVAFFDQNGEITYDYDEDGILSIEAVS